MNLKSWSESELVMVGVFVMAVEEVQVVSQFHISVNRTPSLSAGTEITQWKNLYSEIGRKATKLSWFRRIAVVQDHLEGCKLPLWAGGLKMQLSSQAQIHLHALIYYSCLLLTWTRRATRKRAPFWARGPISRPNQQPSRFTWYSCSLPRRHSLMRKTSIPWQGRWFGVNNYCS